MDIRAEVIQLVTDYGVPNELGNTYIQMEKGALGLSGENLFYKPKGGEVISFSDLKEWEQLEWYDFLADNKTLLRTYCTENLEDYGSVEELNWKIKPEPLIVDMGGKLQTLCSIGVAVEVLHPELPLLNKCILVSPDGSWTTLTVWMGDKELETAKDDIMDIGLHILKFVQKL